MPTRIPSAIESAGRATAEAEAERFKDEADNLSARLAEAVLRELAADEATQEGEERVAAFNTQLTELR